MRLMRAGSLVAGVALMATSAAYGTAYASNGSRHLEHSAAASPIVIGADLPVTGNQADFGQYADWAYKNAVASVDAKGGMLVNGKREKVDLVVLDDGSDPNTAASNVRTLIIHDHAVAVLGSMSPELVNPGAEVAERMHVPFVTAADPEQVFASVQKWRWAWDIFFSLDAVAVLPFQVVAGDHVATNKKVAIFYAADASGQGQRAGWEQAMKHYGGYHVVVDTAVPGSLTDFSSMVEAARAADAQVVLAVMQEPQMVSLRREMAVQNYHPAMLVMEQGGEPYAFAQQLGSLSNGVLVAGYWAPTFPFPGAAALARDYTRATGQPWSQHLADETAAAQVLLQAIAKARSTNASAVNAAISHTDLTDQAGRIHFGADHVAVLPVVETQWQHNGKVTVVYPRNRANAKLITPLP